MMYLGSRMYEVFTYSSCCTCGRNGPYNQELDINVNMYCVCLIPHAYLRPTSHQVCIGNTYLVLFEVLSWRWSFAVLAAEKRSQSTRSDYFAPETMMEGTFSLLCPSINPNLLCLCRSCVLRNLIACPLLVLSQTILHTTPLFLFSFFVGSVPL